MERSSKDYGDWCVESDENDFDEKSFFDDLDAFISMGIIEKDCQSR